MKGGHVGGGEHGFRDVVRSLVSTLTYELFLGDHQDTGISFEIHPLASLDRLR